jgi:hypothetical protein
MLFFIMLSFSQRFWFACCGRRSSLTIVYTKKNAELFINYEYAKTLKTARIAHRPGASEFLRQPFRGSGRSCRQTICNCHQ